MALSVTAASQLPDLIVSTGSLSASSAQAGNQITVNYTVKNSGPGSAAASTTRIRLAVNQTATLSDPLLVAFTTPALAVGATSSGSQTVTIPSGTTAGNYYIVVTANADGALTESNGSNNQYPMALSVTAASSSFQIGTRVMAQSGGANVRDEQLDSPPRFSQLGGVHGTIAANAKYGTATGCSGTECTGNWWEIQWDSEPPNQNSLMGWSSESVIALAPTAGDVPQPNWASSNYTNGNPFYPSFAPNAPSNQLDGALGNCTWYAYGRLLDLGASKTQLGYFTGNANTWATTAPSTWVDNTPAVNSIAELDANSGFPLGHVAVVESLNSDGTITVTESSSGLIPTGNWMFLWRHRTVSPNWFSHFIHVPLTSGTGGTPSVSGVQPVPVPGLNGTQTLTINGQNFVSGATATYHDPVNNTTYPNKPTTFVSASQIKDTAFNDGGDAGTWTVTVTNPGGSPSTAANFTVSASTPSVSGVQPVPVPGLNGTQTLTINGQNFVSGATATYHDPVNNTTYPNNPTTFVSASQIKDTAFNDGGDAGTWTVTVTNPGGSPSTAANFTVN
jgi:surface antigen